MRRIVVLFSCVLTAAVVATGHAAGNQEIESVLLAKKLLETQVYTVVPRQTIYCKAPFDADKKVMLPPDLTSNVYKNRLHRTEWEHIVPAENFGGRFDAWHTGAPQCHDKNGNPYRGRKCAERVSRAYRLMQADMYNLYPAVGAVNAARRQYAFTPLFKRVPPAFGSCAVKIRSRRMEPPESARGMIARTYLYMEWAYQMPLLGVMKRKLMQEWNTAYPVTQAECQRAFLIESLQKNEQPFVKTPCVQAGLWPRSKDV